MFPLKLSKKFEVIITRLRTGHTKIHNIFSVKKEDTLIYTLCSVHINIDHIFLRILFIYLEQRILIFRNQLLKAGFCRLYLRRKYLAGTMNLMVSIQHCSQYIYLTNLSIFELSNKSFIFVIIYLVVCLSTICPFVCT